MAKAMEPSMWKTVEGARIVVRPGGRLPHELERLESWLDDLGKKVEKKNYLENEGLEPSVENLRQKIARDPILRMYLENMIKQVPRTKKYLKHHLRNVEHMLCFINCVLNLAPYYDETDMVGCPLNAIFDWSMATPAGYAAFRYPPFNDSIREILSAWCDFLTTEKSRYVLDNKDENGWLSEGARKRINMHLFQYDETKPYWGFKSWNDFFTRKFKPESRPITEPDNDKAIINPCESTPFKISTDAALIEKFWLKSQPYSLRDMMDHEPIADKFVNGSVYQAFLSALNYHRWHSPVSGTILKVKLVPGTYFSESEDQGVDPIGPNDSQAYISHVATRMLIFIQCREASMGVVCLITIGMGEVSSCVSTVKEGDVVKKGDELGYFQYGGSSICVLFQKDVIESFATPCIPQGDFSADKPPVHVNVLLARAN